MVDLKKVNAWVESIGIPITVLAQKMGKSRQTVRAKLDGLSEWTVNDVETFSDATFLTDEQIIEFFLTKRLK